MSTWRYYFDVVVIALSVVAVFVALAPIQRWGEAIPRWIPRTMSWVAFSMLTLRGVGGLIHDGSSDPVWWPRDYPGAGALRWPVSPENAMSDGLPANRLVRRNAWPVKQD